MAVVMLIVATVIAASEVRRARKNGIHEMSTVVMDS
jgi:hypothetical protein